MPSKEFEEFLNKIASVKPNPEMTIQEARASFEKMMKEYPPSDEIVFEPFDLPGVSAIDAIAPASSNEHFALFFHGGGYNAGSVKSHSDLMGRIANHTRVRVIGIDYRLAPEHPFPAAVDDAITAYTQLMEKGVDPDKVFLIGISAGGGLVIALLSSLINKKLRSPKAAAVLSPWVDLTLTSSSLQQNEGKDFLTLARLKASAEMYLKQESPQNPLASPLFGDLRGFPPLLIHVGRNEILLDDAMKLDEKANEAGVNVTLEVFDEMVHAWHIFARKIPEGVEAVDKLNTWLNQHRE